MIRPLLTHRAGVRVLQLWHLQAALRSQIAFYRCLWRISWAYRPVGGTRQDWIKWARLCLRHGRRAVAA